MRKQTKKDLQYENNNESWTTTFIENLEPKSGPWIHRQSVTTAGELVAITTIILVFGFTGVLSPEITGGVTLGAFVAESLSVCITKKTLFNKLLSDFVSPHIFSKRQKSAVATNESNIEIVIEEKNSSKNTSSHTNFIDIFGIIKKKNPHATENSKLINDSENNSYASTGEAIVVPSSQKIEQIAEESDDEVLGSLKY